MTFDDTWESVSFWGCFPTDPGKLEEKMLGALKVCAGETPWRPIPRVLASELWYRQQVAQAAIRAYERYDGRERATDWELVV